MIRNAVIRRLPLAALTLAMNLSGGHALAGDGAPAPQSGRAAGFIRRALSSLDLTDDQKTKVKALFEAEKPAFQALRTEAQAARQALRAATDVATPDPAAVGKAFLRVDAARKAVRTEMQAVRDKVNALLTPEQKARLDGFLAAARSHRRGAGPGPVSN